MKIAFTIFLSLILFVNLFPQNEAAIWYFGDQAGLDFSTGEPKLLVNSAMRAEAGCAVISDKAGELLFYTNGKNVWNRNHQRMPNGLGLNGSQLLNQNSIIVPLPESDSLYYLFTINANYDSVGMNYSIVNMNRENGLGDITLANQLMYKGFLEKLSATAHCNGKEIWVLAHNRVDEFYSFLLTPNGIFEDTIISRIGNYAKADIGYMKMSPASNRIVFPFNNDSLLVEVFRFDNQTGEVSDPISILAKDETVYAYGLEFSPDGNLLYLSTGGKHYRLWQYDLTRKSESEINESATLLAEGNHFAMQLAIDGKIYIAKQNRDYLSVINQPEKFGVECDYQEFAISLQGNNSLMGLPNFITSFFYKPGFSAANTCLGDTTKFLFNQYLNSDSVTWNFGDGSPPVTYSFNPEPVHYYETTGNYKVKMSAYQCSNHITTDQEISIVDYPELDLGNDTSICNSCSVLLDGGDGMDFWIWQDGSESQFYEATESGNYFVLVSKEGCISTDSIQISKNLVKVTIPNAFSPNGDGKNDVFKPVYSQKLTSYQIQIFDRNGRLIYQANEIDNGWNGKYLGSRVMNGVYVYSIVYTHYEENNLNQYNIRGTFVLVD